MTTRENSAGQGTHEYREGNYTITWMGNDAWYVFLGNDDQGQDFLTLKAARKWCQDKEALSRAIHAQEDWNFERNYTSE